MEEIKEESGAEQGATQTPKEEEMRAEIISEFGFDETEDAEKIEKLVKKELEQHGKFSKVIGQKIKHRMEAERLQKELDAKKELEVKDNLSLQDIRALQDVPDEDVEDVVEYAKFKKISIADAKKTTIIQNILAEKAEFRTSAQAADTGKKIIPSKVNEDQVVKDTFENNKIPEKGSDAAEKLFWSKHKR